MTTPRQPVRHGHQFGQNDFLPYIFSSQAESEIVLKALDIKVEISGLYSTTTQTMIFYNPNQRDLAGELTFPMPDNSSVCGYALDVDGELVDGVIIKKEKARHILETEITKGVETDLPDGYIFTDSYGIERESVRAKWWINDSTPLNQAMIDTGVVDHITEHVHGEDFPGYHQNEKPCFVGHYWWDGAPEPISHNIACLDYSVAKSGKLVAYRWQGEEQLTKDNFCWV